MEDDGALKLRIRRHGDGDATEARLALDAALTLATALDAVATAPPRGLVGVGGVGTASGAPVPALRVDD